MKILKKIGVFLLVLIGFGFFLPGVSEFSRTTTINRPAQVVYDNIDDLRMWKTWSPWYAMDTNTVMTFSDSSRGIGAFYTWKSGVTGEGKMTMIEAEAPTKAKYSLVFGSMSPSTASFVLTPKDSTTTEVKWGLRTEFGLNPFGRWFGVFMEKVMATDFENGLVNMKRQLEK